MGIVSRECQKPKRSKEDAAYHKEKMLLCKQEEAGVQLNAEQADWKDDTDDESDDQELEAHYMYMAQLQEVTPDPVDNSGPIFDDEPTHKVQNNNDNYNVFAMENEHPEQLEPSNDIYLTEQGDSNITIDSSVQNLWKNVTTVEKAAFYRVERMYKEFWNLSSENMRLICDLIYNIVKKDKTRDKTLSKEK
ncbi:hypothetical protein Tco_0444533 [Tanacetum coccineum]